MTGKTQGARSKASKAHKTNIGIFAGSDGYKGRDSAGETYSIFRKARTTVSEAVSEAHKKKKVSKAHKKMKK
jgi:hypothetical protein